MCDDGIEQLLAQVNEFIIEELNDDTFSQLLLMLAEKELRDEAERSSRLRIQRGHSPKVRFTVNGTEYTKGYYLADGIYPEWATIVKSFPCPQDPKRKKFKEMQEAARKDVERAFGVLQSRWAIIRGAARFWHTKTMNDIIYACIILA
ncbi:ALP1-like protein isoform X1 [Tanacetum coccineum]